jgi:hypothetical protein
MIVLMFSPGGGDGTPAFSSGGGGDPGFRA